MSNIVLVGAGGAGVSAIARILSDLGFKNIVAIDSKESQITEILRSSGIKVIIGHGIYKIQADDLVIYSEAAVNQIEVVDSFNFASQRLHKFHAPLSYFQFIGEISKHFFTVAVAGTNGKSSTTGMLIDVARKMIPEFGVGVVGAMIPDLDGRNYEIGNHRDQIYQIFEKILFGKESNFDYSLLKKYFFVIEACEWQEHFLEIDADYSMITNVELDHSDYFPDLETYQNAFNKFFDQTRFEVFVNDQEKSIDFIRARKSNKNCVLPMQNYTLKVLGAHNQRNANLVRGVIRHMLEFTRTGKQIHHETGLVSVTPEDETKIHEILSNFRGIWRRCELLGKTSNGAIVYTDYAHHPSSVKVVFEALRAEYKDKKLTAILQPHQLQRVLEFREEFILEMKKFDKVYLYSIFTAREDFDDLKNRLGTKHGLEKSENVGEIGLEMAKQIGCEYITKFEDLEPVFSNSSDSDCIVVMTAGDLDYEVRKKWFI